MRGIRASMLALLVALVTFLASCDLSYKNSAEARLILTNPNNLDIDTMDIVLSTGSNSVAYRTYRTAGIGELALGSLFYGSYLASASGYSATGRLVAQAAGDLTVDSNGGLATLELVPVAAPSTSGYLEARCVWTNNSSFTVARIALVCGERVLYSSAVEEGCTEFTVECELEGMEGENVCFVLYSSDHELARSASIALTIYGGQTTRLDDISLEIAALPAVENLEAEWYGDGYEGIRFTFTLPDADISALILHYSDSQAIYRRQYSLDELEAMKGEDGRCTGIIHNAREGEDYRLSLTLLFSNGTTSPAVSREISMPIALDRITISPIASGLEPGAGGKLTLTKTPVDATEMGGEWTSSNPAVITVDQEGNYSITGFGRASVSYRAKNMGRIASIPVTISLAKPELKAAASDNAIEINWTASALTQSFELYRSVDGVQEDAIVLDGSTRVYSDTNVISGHSYSYRIRAIASGDAVFSEETEAVTFTSPSITLVIQGVKENITVTLTSNDADGRITNGSLVAATASPLEGITAYQWLINGQAASDQFEIEGNILFTVPLESDAYIDFHRYQELTLVFIAENGQKYSAGFYIEYRPVE